MSNDNTDVLYVVVSNDEGQYSIWPDGKALPSGWAASVMRASKAACLHLISQSWTDRHLLLPSRQMRQLQSTASSNR